MIVYRLKEARLAYLLGFTLVGFAMLGCADPSPDEANPDDSRTVDATRQADSAADVSALSSSMSSAMPSAASSPAQPARKQAYFGDLHIHSSWSLDAFAFGVRVGPEDAYRYARGDAIEHVSGKKIRMQGPPLDFVALTEHANYMGISSAAQDPASPVRDIPLIQGLLSSDESSRMRAMGSLFSRIGRDVFVPALDPAAVIEPAWQQLVALADRYNDPGNFTAFVGYEYTSMPDGQNLHRNVIFRGSDVPAKPFSTFDSGNPEDLWRWMDAARQRGSDVLAIPHNANGSNGLMYQTTDQSGAVIDEEYASLRLRNEPVSEVIQIKGQSETHPMLSPGDEWSGFEILGNILGRPDTIGAIQGSYARQAMKDGLVMEEASGVNPYRMGMIGSSDGHNASSPVEESNYTGKIGVSDGTAEIRILSSAKPEGFDFSEERRASPFSAAGLAGIWAPANTREAIFDALRAREVFATSGPRLRLRMFAGWDFTVEDMQSDMAEAGYARGVPMGGALVDMRSDREEGARPPSFMVQSLRDPNEAPLARLQMIKGWVENGRSHERVFDIACANGERPDPATHRCAQTEAPPDLDGCSYDASSGSAQLSAVWRDPAFNPSQRAFYYTRVLQVPTCRWSTYDAKRLGVELPVELPAWFQERAVSSPVWYAPAG